MSKLRELIESANKLSNKIGSNQKEEDGTASDLGVVPTGHKEKDKSNITSVNEDTISYFINDEGETITYNADSDEEGLYIRRPSGVTMRLRGDKLVIKTPEKGEKNLNLKELKPWIQAVQYLLDKRDMS